MIGASVRRIEDPVLLRGQGRFAADVDLPGQVHMRVVRSPVAAGRLTGVRVAAARALPGVVAVWTGDDVAELPPIGFRLTAQESMRPYRQPVLARDRVRYVGEPVAVVFADSAYVAEDAADLVEVDVETDTAVLSMDGDPVAWPTYPGAGGSETTLSESLTSEIGYGDVEAAFTAAERVVEVDVRVGRHTGVPMECRGAVAHVEPTTGVLVMDGAAKVPFWNRDAIAEMVGLPPQRVALREGHVGGGFGPRGELYPEDVLVCLAAVRLGTPVKWVEDRQEHLVATNHSRDQRHRLRAAVDADGVVTALDGEFWLDQGAYVRTHAATVPSLTASMLPGPYRVPAYRMRGHIRMSNKTPAGTYRSPGRYESTFARERLMDAVAAELGLSPLEVRRRNFIPAAEMPYSRPLQAMGTELTYDSGDYALLLDRMEQRWDLTALAEAVAARRAAGELVGIGFGCFVEKSGLGPYEGVRIKVDAAGSVQVVTGASSVGQGVDTVLAQVVGDVLGVGLDAIRVVRGQTEHFDYGRGAFATRLSVMAGSATVRAAEALRDKAVAVAAHEMEVDPSDLELVDGVVRVLGDPGSSMSLGEVARLLEPVGAHSLGMEPGLNADGWFHTDHMTYPYGIHAAVIRIDPGTGEARIERYLVGYDVGKALNPVLVEGQIVGGVAQGIGGALLEQFLYTDEGQPQCTTFMDYLLPTVHEMPPVEVIVTEDAPSPLNPLGVKGAGEGGTNAVAATVAAALDDALERPGAITSVPVTPARLRAIVAAASAHPRPRTTTTKEKQS
ncbi:xanthine dehydrogenase family protein molybdopterin-binding subunit [Geodermatophilus sp. DF01-2]|uniref:xanthine dehydrogenase family protein molybdopterin-binding subunit n=1 Tax=Geodermatophilus sp. DF01-2 TaxID=2559610 RepID=UPI001073A9C1|nr:xanthine dehydrogenase family protein molybdopterin-binding subunit [Geodermatophilus sp. DF01_2]TFV56060.1 xanthine dehydrogenase family protein molybdopterin-binding subunit [Geodermatophilus sp. DF01_2]